MLAPAASRPRHAKGEAKPRRRVVVPTAIALVVIAIAAIGFVLFDRTRDHSAQAKSHASSAPSTPGPASPGGVTLPVVVVGANCTTLGAAGVTEGGAPAYCAHLSTTDAAIWSLYPGEISSPTVTAGPNDEVYPLETESPVLVCMEQTGQSRLNCHDDILQHNATTSTPSS
jgi:serine/threonine-protein kinase